jgi:hypothetical protein
VNEPRIQVRVRLRSGWKLDAAAVSACEAFGAPQWMRRASTAALLWSISVTA